MKFGVVIFPGTWSDKDCYHFLTKVLKQEASYIWHKDTEIFNYDCIILPGGFSYGDYLRPGAIARFSPIMEALKEFAAQGKFILGICNGFQILCEAGLLPGVLIPNNHLQYRCQWVYLRVENNQTPFTRQCDSGQLLRIPISHYEGNYYASQTTLADLEKNNRVIFRYCDTRGETTLEANPNGSLNNIAGIINRQGNVLGMMPHPERAGEAVLGSTSGNSVFNSLVAWVNGEERR